jgi:hypothetical protein
MRYKVGFTYTVWVEVEADGELEAIDRAIDTEFDYVDVRDTGAILELDENTDPIVTELADADE